MEVNNVAATKLLALAIKNISHLSGVSVQCNIYLIFFIMTEATQINLF